jgi:hypothetical protein
MATDGNYQVAREVGDRIGAGPATSALPVADQLVNWTLGPGADRESGNACIGIAVGCLMSLPIWVGLLIFYLLLA